MSSLPLRIERIDPLTPQIRRLILVADANQPLPDFTPGAHIEVQIPGSQTLWRAYSLVNVPGNPHYEIAVQLEDPSSGGSRWMHGVQVGQQLLIRPPNNHFPLAADACDYLLIAGGIGITPMLGMARALAASQQPFTLHYAGRDASRMAYLQEVQALESAQCWISGGDPARRLPLNRLLQSQAPGRHLYVCGPKSLISAVLQTARELGWDERLLHSELFIGSLDTPSAGAFEVQLRSSGVTLQVPAGQSVLEAMIEAGLDPMFDCRRGDCGVCVAQVIEGVAEHRDICLSERERATGSFCTCVSRASSARLVLDL
ncbi:PDR/VanB family oxidoreductase [Pseudomonas violetae]|jgi:ferredoxin-NADP reductase|uniref:PDR/VanB family oxidoreductase n=1 Tax=Pseudomonas violetae TaxID=2915813 RepID=A0ABT0F4A1_9PSED|nr:PDR/VanB family oxidoreductase [Pseudomonas violetae]MCK1792845.1 PDR/VanB family oxidoreductase [Pseudomonas violetae]